MTYRTYRSYGDTFNRITLSCSSTAPALAPCRRARLGRRRPALRLVTFANPPVEFAESAGMGLVTFARWPACPRSPIRVPSAECALKSNGKDTNHRALGNGRHHSGTRLSHHPKGFPQQVINDSSTGPAFPEFSETFRPAEPRSQATWVMSMSAPANRLSTLPRIQSFRLPRMKK